MQEDSPVTLRRKLWPATDRCRRNLVTAALAALGAMVVGASMLSAVPVDSGSSPSAPRKETAVPARMADAISADTQECDRRMGTDVNLALTVKPALPIRIAAGSDLVRSEIVLTNQGKARLRGTTRSTPDLVLAQQGLVVTAPVPADAVAVEVDLAPGESQTFKAVGSLRHCNDGKLLPRGTYELFAMMTVHLADGTATQVVGGPWPLELH